MNTQELLENFSKNHRELSDYINALPEEKLTYSANGKWTPLQQLSHVYMTLTPFPKALASKEFILQKFGKINRPT